MTGCARQLVGARTILLGKAKVNDFYLWLDIFTFARACVRLRSYTRYVLIGQNISATMRRMQNVVRSARTNARTACWMNTHSVLS